MHSNVTQGDTVCNPSFIGYRDYAYSSQMGGSAGESAGSGASHGSAGASSSSLLALSLDGDLACIKADMSPVSSSATPRRQEKRKRQSIDQPVEDGLWGQRRPSPPPQSSTDYNPPIAGPSSSSSASSVSAPSRPRSVEQSNWLPPSSSSAPASYAPSSVPSADLANFFPSAYQANTGYAALAPPVVGSYPSSANDAPWWTRIDLGQGGFPPVNASYVHAAYPSVISHQQQQQQQQQQLQQTVSSSSSMYEPAQSEPMADYSFLGAIDNRHQDPRLVTSRHAAPVNGEMTRYQQLLAAKYASSSVQANVLAAPSAPAAAAVTSVAPSVGSQSLASSSPTECSSQSAVLSPHLTMATANDYSQYPRATPSALFAPDPRPANDYSQPTTTSSALYAKDASTRFPSYFPSSSSSYGQGYPSYQMGASASHGSVPGAVWPSALYDGALRRDPGPQAWDISPAESSGTSSSAAQVSSYSSSSNMSAMSAMSPYPPTMAGLNLPPTPALGTSSLSPHPPTPSPGSQATHLPMSSLLLPSYLNPNGYAPIASRTPQPPLSSLATSPISATLPLSAHAQPVPTPPSPFDRPLSLLGPSDPRHPANPSVSSISSSSSHSAMLPPRLPLPRPTPPTLSAEDWNSITPVAAVPSNDDLKGKGKAGKNKRVKGEPPEFGMMSSSLDDLRRESSEGSSSAPSTEEVPMTVTEKDGKRKLMLACHFCRGRKLK